jgi:hypothetical protein
MAWDSKVPDEPWLALVKSANALVKQCLDGLGQQSA